MNLKFIGGVALAASSLFVSFGDTSVDATFPPCDEGADELGNCLPPPSPPDCDDPNVAATEPLCGQVEECPDTIVAINEPATVGGDLCNPIDCDLYVPQPECIPVTTEQQPQGTEFVPPIDPPVTTPLANTLPETGNNLTFALVAAGLVAVGGILLYVRRRPSTP